MPRVTTHTNNGRGKTVYHCTACREPITKGQRYFHWTRRIGPKAGSFRHVACGPPRPTELTSRKTAQVDEAIGDYTMPDVDVSALEELDHDAPPDTVDVDTSPFQDAVGDIADVAESVADEYEEGVSNMPEQLQYAPTGEAMTDVAERLREWVQELRDKSEEGPLTVDLPAREFDPEGDQEEQSELAELWLGEAEQAITDAWEEFNSELESIMGDVPEYEG